MERPAGALWLPTPVVYPNLLNITVSTFSPKRNEQPRDLPLRHLHGVISTTITLLVLCFFKTAAQKKACRTKSEGRPRGGTDRFAPGQSHSVAYTYSLFTRSTEPLF